MTLPFKTVSRFSWWWGWAAVLALCSALPTSALAQRTRERGVVRFEPRDIPIRPGWARPAPPEPRAITTPSAREECGADRRCRIDRMRRRRHANIERRAVAANETYLELESAREQHEDWQRPRLIRPWALEMTVSDIYVAPTFGFHPLPFLAVSVSAGYFFGGSQYREVTRLYDAMMPELGSFYVGATTDLYSALMVGGNVRVLFMEDDFSPYASVGFEVITLGGVSHNEYSRTEFFGEPPPVEPVSVQGTIEIHALPIQLGIELQFAFGLRLRLGAVMRPTVYLRVRDLDGRNVSAESGAHAIWRMFGAEGALGWSL